jgi:hypothetical protein
MEWQMIDVDKEKAKGKEIPVQQGSGDWKWRLLIGVVIIYLMLHSTSSCVGVARGNIGVMKLNSLTALYYKTFGSLWCF